MEKTTRFIKSAIEIIIYVMLSLMTLMIGWEVFSRFVFNVTPAWLNQLTILFMVWVGLIGMAYGFHEKSHIKIVFLVRKFPIVIQKTLMQFNRILSILFGLFMVVKGGQFALKMSHSILPGIPLPTAVIYASVPITGVLIIFFIIEELVIDIKKMREKGGLN